MKFQLLGLAAATLFAASTAGAQSLAVSPTSVTGSTSGGATTPGSVALVYTAPGAAPPVGFQADMTFNNTVLTATPTVVTPGGYFNSCVVVGGNLVRLVVANGGGGQAASGTYCNITLSVTAASPAATYPLTLTNDTNLGGGLTSGAVVVSAISSPTVVYAPTPAAGVTFPAAPISTNGTQNVTIDFQGGTAGQTSTVNNCSVTGTGLTMGAFTSASAPGPATVGVDGTIPVICAYGAAARTGTLACSEVTTTPAATTTRSWALNCPAGTTVPVYGSNPLPGGTVAMVGAPGQLLNGSVAITNTGTANLTVGPCVVGGAGFAIGTQPTTPLAPGASSAATVTCTAPAVSGTSLVPNGTLSCPHNAAGTPATYTLTCSAVAANIPTVSDSGKWILISLLAGLGVLGFALRRNA